MVKITSKIAKEVRSRYLVGQKPYQIAKDLGISTTSVNKAINDEGYVLGKIDVPEEQRALFAEAKVENERIYQVKEQMMNFIDAAISEGMASPNKLLFIPQVISAMNTLDRILRLNKGEATERTENVTKHIDYAEIIKELKTPEDQFAFLKQQLEEKRQEEKEVIDIK